MEPNRTSDRGAVRFLVGLVSLSVVTAVVLLAAWAVLPRIFLGWTPTAITSGSMAPLIEEGDVVLAELHDGVGLTPGTVVVYQDPSRSGYATHRIDGMADDGSYFTKGDANAQPDSTPLRPENVVGRSRLLVPFIGYPVVWYLRGAWIELALAAVLMGAAIWCSRWAFRFDPWASVPGSDQTGPPASRERELVGVAPITLVGLPPVSSAGFSSQALSEEPPRKRRSGWSMLAVFPAVVVLVGIVATGSSAALTDVTDNGGNSLTADTLDPPTGLTPTCGATITLDWTETPDTYASGHRVLRSATSGGPYVQIAEVTPRTTTTYDDTPPGGIYYYVVRAFYLSWESTDTNEALASTNTCATFGSMGDTHAQQDKATTNFGTITKMLVRSWKATKNARAFVQFDVSSIPAGATIDTATLTLCAERVPTGTRTYEVHRVTAGWGETTLTWNNQPGVAAAATDSATPPSSPSCMTWTVTANVQLWVDGTANDGWRVWDTVEGADPKQFTEFRTRENSVAAERPKLEVFYSAP